MRPNVNWDDQADMYSAFSFCELDDTRTYLEELLSGSHETLLDVCCGAGRVSVVAAEMGARVTGIDSSPRMLEHARANADAHCVGGRCDFRLLDWDHVLPGQNLERHDVVVASRCHAMMDVEKLSSLARRAVGVQIFANAPSIPALLDVLFSGCGDAGSQDDGSMPESAGASSARRADQGGPADGNRARTGGRPDGPGASEAIYLTIADKAFRAGYDPNVRIFPERFRKRFGSTEEVVSWVASLRPARAEGNLERLGLNVAPFLSDGRDGVELCIATKAAIVWWEVE